MTKLGEWGKSRGMDTREPRKILVLGGARSGKSLYAEQLITRLTAPWVYVATAEVRDDEMRQRVALHQSRRGTGWETQSVLEELPALLSSAAVATKPVLVDCLTLWVSNLMLAGKDVAAACSELEVALASREKATTVLVSNEVGLGIVPGNALARRFRDEAGRVNQRMAQAADHVVFMVAGLPMTVK